MKPDILEEYDTEIIDVHTHLGDILYPNGGELIDKTGMQAKSLFDTGWLTALFQYKLGEELKEPGKFARSMATYSGRQRNFGATLENMQIELARSGVNRVCCLPIPPNVVFGDLKKAQEKDNRVIPFTGVDFNDMEGFEDRLQQDVENGAKGMKIHPIIQNVSPTDERVRQVVEEFKLRHKLPIIFHTSRSQYYLGKEREKETPDNGRLELMKQFIESLRNDIAIILGHAGMFQFEYVLENLAQYPNVHVDTTFQHPERIQRLLQKFGSHRVIFGSDWPYGDMAPAIMSVEEALEHETDPQVHERVFNRNIKGLMGMV